MIPDKTSRLVLRAFALAAVAVGILSLLGVRPMNSRTIELVLGTASLIAGAALLALTMRAKSANRTASIA